MKKLILILILLLTACVAQNKPKQSLLVTNSIQACLNTVQPGGVCDVPNGTYNEALTLKTTGTASAPITIKCETPLGCVIDSGAAKSVLNSTVSYVIIDGFKFASAYTAGANEDQCINFSSGSNNIFRNNSANCGIFVRGDHFVIDNNTLDGGGKWKTGYWERDAVSHDNVFSHNNVKGFTVRDVWSMDSINNFTADSNVIDVNMYGIDCDGAGHRVTNCKVTNNTLTYLGKTGWGAAIFLENCFTCNISNNYIRSDTNAPGLYSINYGQGQSLFNSQWIMPDGAEWRGTDTNTIISYNVFDYKNSAMYFISVAGMTIDHNTLYSSSATYDSVVMHAEKSSVGVVYQPNNEKITNNIFNQKGVNWRETVPSNLVNTGNFIGDPKFVNLAAGDFHLQPNSTACGAGAFVCGVLPTGSPSPISTVVTPSFSATPSLTPIASSTFTPTIPTVTRTFTPSPSLTPTLVPPSKTPTPTPHSITVNGTQIQCPCQIVVP